MWPVVTSDELTLNIFRKSIDEAEATAKIRDKDIYIFGASVRGTLLGMVLNEYGIERFSYVDNAAEKWNDNINDHMICSPSILEDIEGKYIFIPIENADSVEKQIQKYGYKRNISYVRIYVPQYERYMQEISGKNRIDRIIFGESVLNDVPIADINDSLGIALKKSYGEKYTSCCSMDCASMRLFYFTLKALINNDKIPKQVILFLNFETMTSVHAKLPRTQHAGLLEMINEFSKCQDKELSEYLPYAHSQSENYKYELKYSPQRIGLIDASNDLYRKEYSKYQMLYDMDINSDEFNYLDKIISLSKSCNIIMTVYILPVNYELLRIYYPEEFDKKYLNNILKLTKYCMRKNVKMYDLSFLLSMDKFLAYITVNDAINSEGRKIILEKINEENLSGE